jgi:hypothetical protein
MGQTVGWRCRVTQGRAQSTENIHFGLKLRLTALAKGMWSVDSAVRLEVRVWRQKEVYWAQVKRVYGEQIVSFAASADRSPLP